MFEKPLFRACLFSFLDIGALSLILGSMLPDLRAAYALTPALGGTLLAVYSVGNLSAGIVGGAAALVIGQRPAIVLLTALTCLGMLGLALLGSPGGPFPELLRHWDGAGRYRELRDQGC